MHASIAFFVMMVGGCLPPQSEITTIPLKDDSFGLTSIQELEWKERVRRVPTMPRVPTLGEGRPTTDDGQSGRYQGRPYAPTDPKAPQRAWTGVMPSPPTSAGPANGAGYTPGGIGQGNSGQGNYGQANNYSPVAPPRNDLYQNAQIPRNPVGNNAMPGAPMAPTTPTANNYIASTNPLNQTLVQAGLGGTMSNPFASTGSGTKPYSDYQRPNGYSPWTALYTTPTNNGTMNPYTTAVQPALQQQNFNAHISEQINGVRTMMQPFYSGTPGVEVPVGGNGLVNPQIFQNYKGYYPTY